MKLILSELDREIVHEAGGSPTEAPDQGSEGQGAAEPPPLADYALWRKAHPDE
jgi:hypothetical protein